MRITAEIIDEESFFISKEIIDNHERSSHIRSRNSPALNNNQCHFAINSAASGSFFEMQNLSQHTQTVQEVTEKFQDLNLYDMPTSPSQQISCSSRTVFHTMRLSVNNLPDGCTQEELKALFSQYGTVKQIDVFFSFGCVEMSTFEEAENACKALNKYQLRGCALSVGVFNGPKVGSPPPLWFQYHMSKIKQDLKKELLEEMLNISTDTRQAQADVPSTKSSLALKEDNLIQCQGEVVHNDIYCDNCDQLIHGIRYKCGNCSDFDLCQECESLPNVHNKAHIFLKIRYPFALKMYQKQKWQELMSPLPIKPARFSDSPYSKGQKKKLYEATFLCDETVPDGTIIPPSTRFVKSWKVMNSGIRVWTHTTKLHLIQGSANLIPSNEQVDVPHLKPGEEGIVSILFTSPTDPGVYRSHWNFCHKSRPFGAIVWCHIIVKPIQEELRCEPSVSPKVNELSEKIVNKQMEVSNIAQVLTAVKEEHEEDNMVPRKLIVNSHTATPNNTPFALTPPKSPDHETFSKSVCEMASDKAFLSQYSDNEDDECSVVSLNSTDSDTEFVVIPMPKCFNLSESFISEHFRMPHNLIEAEVITNLDIEVPKDVQVKNTTEKPLPNSENVSQETGVPELSESVCKLTVVEGLVNNQQTTTITQVATDGSSSEVSIIESDSSSPAVENVNQTFDSINVKLSSKDTFSEDEMNQIAARLTDCVTTVAESATNEVNQEQIIDIPNSATFPKFPVEGVTGDIFERQPLNPNNPEERTIQVLPEGLVFGALSAAASVYNTAKAVISTIQQPKENVEGISQPLQRPTNIHTGTPSVNRSETLNPMDQLIEMGFCNRQQNETLLKKHNGDVAVVVAELVNLNDNEWYASRHVTPSPPGFLD
nr:uncharacterized protein LOC107457248 isoform X2 [Parasteatoda tepidariorum]